MAGQFTSSAPVIGLHSTFISVLFSNSCTRCRRFLSWKSSIFLSQSIVDKRDGPLLRFSWLVSIFHFDFFSSCLFSVYLLILWFLTHASKLIIAASTFLSFHWNYVSCFIGALWNRLLNMLEKHTHTHTSTHTHIDIVPEHYFSCFYFVPLLFVTSLRISSMKLTCYLSMLTR